MSYKQIVIRGFNTKLNWRQIESLQVTNTPLRRKYCTVTFALPDPLQRAAYPRLKMSCGSLALSRPHANSSASAINCGVIVRYHLRDQYPTCSQRDLERLWEAMTHIIGCLGFANGDERGIE